MRRVFFAAMVLCGTIAALADGEVKWLETVHDFGAFDEDTKAKTALYRFVNTGDEPVTIISATATCGCTTPKYDHAPIAPGDTTVIEVSYDPSGRPGAFSKQVYVRTTASPERERLIIKGTVIGNAETVQARYPVSAGPLKLRNGAAMLGRVYASGEKMTYVDGYNQSGDTIRPVVEALPEYIEVTVTPPVVPPGEQVALDFRFCGDRCGLWGVVTDSVTIAPNPGADAIVFPIVAVIEEDFSKLTPEELKNSPLIKVSSDHVTLPPLGDTPVSVKVEVTNTGVEPLLLHRVYTQDPGMTVETDMTTIKNGRKAFLTISCDPAAAPAGAVTGKITIISNDPTSPTTTIRVVGERLGDR